MLETSNLAPHQHRLVELFANAADTNTRLSVAIPPQHGATTVALISLAKMAARSPHKSFRYVTYNSQRAHMLRRQVRDALGAFFNDDLYHFGAIDEPPPKCVIDGAVFVDSPYKNRREAFSRIRLAAVMHAVRELIEPRVNNAPIFVLSPRWHDGDVIGTLSRSGYALFDLPAVDDLGQPIWPDYWSAADAERRRRMVGEPTWSAQYLCRPSSGTPT